MTATFTTVVLSCGCGRRWEHVCDTWHREPVTVGEATTRSTTDPEPLIVQAILGLPSRLRAHRAATGQTMRDVAAATGIAASTIHRIERGADFSVDSLLRLCAYLEEQNP
jgi:DNA-binding XRE family transcriptional regulator